MRTITKLAVGCCLVLLAVVACGKKKNNSAAPPVAQQANGIGGEAVQAQIPPAQMMVVEYNGGYIVQLPEGQTIIHNGVEYTLRPDRSYVIGNTFQTVYMDAAGNELIITGIINQGLQAAGTMVTVSNVRIAGNQPAVPTCVSNCQSTIVTVPNTRNGFSPMRTAAYDQCREFFPPQLDSLSGDNRARRHACQAEVARTTFEDEVDWREDLWNSLGD